MPSGPCKSSFPRLPALGLPAFGLAVVLIASGPALAGSGQEISGPKDGAPGAECQGGPCPDTGAQGGAPQGQGPDGTHGRPGQASGPASDTTGGNEGSFADFER